MTYESFAACAQIVAMAIFGTVMAGVLVYALRPGNKARFDDAARLPLLREEEGPIVPNVDKDGGKLHGRT